MNKLPIITIQSGTIEALKWLALLSMTVDHANRLFLNGGYHPAYCIGRLAMPLFAFVFAYNLARNKEMTIKTYLKTSKRLLLFGVLATPAYIQLIHPTHLIPLNIMFTLLIAATTMFVYPQKGGPFFAFGIFFLGSLLVEYSWVGVALCVSFWLYLRNPTLGHAIFILISYLLLNPVNGNNWAIVTLPIIILAAALNIKLPRLHYLFWIYYPLHLTVLAFIKVVIQR